MKRLAALAAMKLSLYLKTRADSGIFQRYGRLLDATVTQEEIASYDTDDIYKRADESDIRISRILALCGDNKTARTCLELSVLLFLEKQTEEILPLVCGVKYATVEAAAKLVYNSSEVFSYIPEILDAYNRLETILSSDKQSSDFMHSSFTADSRLIAYMSGSDVPDIALKNACNTYSAEKICPVVFGDELKKLSERLEFLISVYEPRIIVHVSGLKTSGRFFAARYAASQNGLDILSADYDYIIGYEKPMFLIRKIIREIELSGACLCLRNVHKTKETEDVLRCVVDEYKRFKGKPLFLTTDRNIKLLPFFNAQFAIMEIQKCTPSQSVKLWDAFTDRHCCGIKVNTAELASKMNLTAGQIERIAKELALSDNIGDTSSNEIFRICYRILDDGRYDNIKRVEAGYTIDDLKIDEKNKNTLRDICNQVEYRQRVFDDWGMSSKYAYGKCVSVLFSGPPGTGKTMAVHVLSSMLGLELFKVDLSQLVDKYIGETEKRLEEVFSRAEKSNMILFFDEADSVMGKRSEVNDSKDKYANTEISFILQRMEEYDGIVILATNYIQNIDTAFMRRIRYVVNFPIPDAAIRKQIWMSAFAKSVPLDDEIDFDFLAEKFELAGGNIKNIVLNATFFAASENRSVEMRHILKAVHKENTKDKRVSFIEDFEHYAYLLE